MSKKRSSAKRTIEEESSEASGVVSVKLSDEDKEALDRVKRDTGVRSTADAIRYALRSAVRELDRSAAVVR